MSRPYASFHHKEGVEWSAMRNAEAYIREQGWSVGPSDITGKRGIVKQPGVRIAKWKNLTWRERDQCDGTLEGRGRDTGRTIALKPVAPTIESEESA